MQEKRSVEQNITLRYSIALMLIAVLATSAFFVLHAALKESESTAYVVNISGKQRMLSQHIAHDIYKLHYYYANESQMYEKIVKIKEQLNQHSTEMLEANTILSSGERLDGSKLFVSQAMENIYFEKLQLAERVKEYNLIAKDAIEAMDLADTLSAVGKIARYSEPLLYDLNRAVAQYQKEGEQKIAQIKMFETLIWILTLITLVLEVIFIFQPMVREIRELARSKNQLLESLQQKVELRTLYLEEANQKLKEMAYHDPLTGLRNRLSLESDIEFLLQQHQNHNAPYAVLMFDIDYFKELNDTHGHDFGDIVLEELAKLFRETFREGDKIYRTGGEEFVVLLNRCSYEDALLVAHSTLRAVRNYPFQRGDLKLHKTVSCGLYHSKIKAFSNYKEILKAVDVALYEAKEGGRDIVRVYQKEQDPHKGFDSLEKIEILFEDFQLQNVLFVEKRFEQISGYTQDEFVSKKISFRDIVHPLDQDILQDIRDSKLQTIRLKCADEKIKIFKFSIDQTKRGCMLKLQDVLELGELVGNSMLLHNFNAMMQNSDDYIYFKDANHLYTAASQTLVELTSVENRQDLIAKTDYELFDSFYADKYYQLEKDVLSGVKEMSQELQPLRTKDGREAIADNRKYPIKTKDGKIIGLFGIARECSEKNSTHKA